MLTTRDVTFRGLVIDAVERDFSRFPQLKTRNPLLGHL